MSSRPENDARKKILFWRIFWFFAGSGVNYLLISTPFHWLKAHTAMPTWAISACSTAASTSLLFLWNYTVNFRTNLRKRDALPRYLAAVGCMWLLQAITLTILKSFNAGLAFSLFGKKLDLDVLATQALLAGIKFPLYHKWAFPLPKETPPPVADESAPRESVRSYSSPS